MENYKDHFQLTAVFVEEPEGGYSAYIEEIQGINTQGETIDEARENLKDALSLFMEVNKQISQRNSTNQQNQIREPLSL
nr:type II toxin-antitoxin system HicB family antitoxin [Bacteroidota bacterium]